MTLASMLRTQQELARMARGGALAEMTRTQREISRMARGGALAEMTRTQREISRMLRGGALAEMTRVHRDFATVFSGATALTPIQTALSSALSGDIQAPDQLMTDPVAMPEVENGSVVHPVLVGMLMTVLLLSVAGGVYASYEDEQAARAINTAIAQIGLAITILLALGFLPPKK